MQNREVLLKFRNGIKFLSIRSQGVLLELQFNHRLHANTVEANITIMFIRIIDSSAKI